MYFYVDYYYIPHYQFYRKKHYIHELFVYGFDLNNNRIYFGDNVLKGEYCVSVCQFQDMELAYWSVLKAPEYMQKIYLIRPKPDITWKIDAGKIRTELENYLYSRKANDYMEQQECIYGFRAVDYIYKECIRAAKDLEYLNHRPFHLLYEHKLLMEIRIQYLMQEGLLVTERNLLLGYTELKNEYWVLRNMAVGYNNDKNKEVIEKIIYQFGGLIGKEKELTADFLYKIKG